MVAVAVVAGIVGAKLWHVLDTPSGVSREWAGACSGIRPALPGTAGWSSAFRALVLQGWRAKIGALRTLDLAAPAAAIGYGMGRIGCFLSGDGCYGIPAPNFALGHELSQRHRADLCARSPHAAL